MALRAAVPTDRVHVRFLRYSAFYTPLLLTLNSPRLKDAGVTVTYDRCTPQLTMDAGFADGSVQVGQSAPAVSFKPVLAGHVPAYRHFALLNSRDGFFLGARTTTNDSTTTASDSWQWGSGLAGRTALVDHFFQPLALFKTALRVQGVDEAAVSVVDAGSPAEIEAAFRAGRGDLVHLQGPGPQQLEQEGLCKVVASVGEAAVPLAFSSLCATPEWLASPVAPLFMAAFTEARARAATAPPAQIADAIAGFLPEFSSAALVATIDNYQRLGTWQGSEAIDPGLYADTVKIFLDVGYIDSTPPLDLVIAQPPQPAA